MCSPSSHVLTLARRKNILSSLSRVITIHMCESRSYHKVIFASPPRAIVCARVNGHILRFKLFCRFSSAIADDSPGQTRFVPSERIRLNNLMLRTYAFGLEAIHRWGTWFQTKLGATAKFRETSTKVGKFTAIPGPMGLPLLGSVLEYTPLGRFSPRNFNKAIWSRHQRYGNIFRERILLDEFIYVSDPKDIRVLVQNEGRAPCRPHLEPVVESRRQLGLPLGITAEQGDVWLRSRTSVNGAIACPKALKQYRFNQQIIAKDFIELIRNKRDSKSGEVESFEQWLNRWALESIAVALLNNRLGLLNADPTNPNSPAEKLRLCMDIFFDYGARLTFGLPSWKLFNTRQWKIFCQSQVDEFENAGHFVTKKLNQINNEQRLYKVPPSCLLEHLISNNNNLSQIEATTICLEMLAGGIDTTATAAVFTLYELARNIKHQETLRLLAKKEKCQHNSEFTKYLKACIWESMRLHPLTYANMRKTETDLILSGYHVPAGSVVRYTSHLINLKNEKYFPKATEFLPERWLDRKSEYRCTEQFTFTPFGHGARQCPGRRVAEQELNLLLREIIVNFNVGYYHDDIKTKVRLFNAADRPARFSFQPI